MVIILLRGSQAWVLTSRRRKELRHDKNDYITTTISKIRHISIVYFSVTKKKKRKNQNQLCTFHCKIYILVRNLNMIF